MNHLLANPNALALMIPIVGAIALFSFLSIAAHSDAQRRERETYYKNETFKKLAESSPDGAKAVMDLIRGEAQREARKRKDGMRIGGLIVALVGLSLVAFFAMNEGRAAATIGLIPLAVGVALLAGSFFISNQ